MRDVEAAVGRTLQGTENAASFGGALDAHVQEAAEGAHAGLAVLILVERGDKVLAAVDLVRGGQHLTGDLGVALVKVSQGRLGAVDVDGHLGEQAARAQQPGGVGRRVVLEADGEPVAGKLRRVRRGDDVVRVLERVHHLADDVPVRELHDEAVARRVVLVLRLLDQALARVVVGLAEAAAAVLGLEPLEVRLVLLDFDEGHGLWWKGGDLLCGSAGLVVEEEERRETRRGGEI